MKTIPIESLYILLGNLISYLRALKMDATTTSGSLSGVTFTESLQERAVPASSPTAGASPSGSLAPPSPTAPPGTGSGVALPQRKGSSADRTDRAERTDKAERTDRAERMDAGVASPAGKAQTATTVFASSSPVPGTTSQVFHVYSFIRDFCI